MNKEIGCVKVLMVICLGFFVLFCFLVCLFVSFFVLCFVFVFYLQISCTAINSKISLIGRN